VIYGCPQVNAAGKCVPVIYYCAKNGIRDWADQPPAAGL